MLSSHSYAGLMSISEWGDTCMANMGVDTLFSEGRLFTQLEGMESDFQKQSVVRCPF